MDTERIWRKRAAGLALKVNFGWWVERFNLLLILVLFVAAVAILIVRSTVAESLPAGPSLAAAGTLLAVVALAAWLLSRRRYIDDTSALVRLDDKLQLRNRLTSAAHGVGPWPETSPEGKDGLKWNLTTASLPAIGGLVLVACAWFIPVFERNPGIPSAPVEPGAWEQMEDWLATLEEEELIDESTIEELEQKIEELREQPTEDWFSHASLEATDTLQDTLGKEIRDLASDAGTLERSMEALQKYRSELSSESRDRLMKEFDEALQSLQNNGMKVNEKLLSQLGQVDPSQLGQESMNNLTKEQLEQLQQQLCKACQGLGSMEGLPSMSEDPTLQQLTRKEGTIPGRGGIERGRGDAPLFFGDESDLKTNKIEGVENPDMSRATLGEVLALGESERDVDETPVGPVAGGEVISAGKGGEAVSRDLLLPDEQAVLKRYFK